MLPGFEPGAPQLSSRRYSSSAAWRTLIVKRREACLAHKPSMPLFLDTLLDNLRHFVSLAFPRPLPVSLGTWESPQVVVLFFPPA